MLDAYLTLGRSGLRVSPLCLGAMTFGQESGWGATEQESVRILDRYLALGGNFIDTANVYSFGHSEKILGDHLGARRDRIVLATKFYANMFPGDPNGGGAGRKSIVTACNESLRRLQTDYIDLYWMHMWDPHTPIEETMRALDDLVTAGKVRYVGFSDTPAWKVAQAQTLAQCRNYAPLIALQVEYSLLERTVEGELIPMARELGLGVTPWAPLKSGALSGKYTREHTPSGNRAHVAGHALGELAYTVVDELALIAKQRDAPLASVASCALAWVRSRPGVTSTLVGARTIEHLEQNLASLSVTLTAEEIQRLDALTQPALSFPVPQLPFMMGLMQGGLSINGVALPASPYAPSATSPKF